MYSFYKFNFLHWYWCLSSFSSESSHLNFFLLFVCFVHSIKMCVIVILVLQVSHVFGISLLSRCWCVILKCPIRSLFNNTRSFLWLGSLTFFCEDSCLRSLQSINCSSLGDIIIEQFSKIDFGDFVFLYAEVYIACYIG